MRIHIKSDISKCVSLIMFLFVLIILGCEKADYGWHKYNNENSEVWGKQSENVQVISHGWKIIENSQKENGIYEWGWEVTIKIKEAEDQKQYLLGIEKLEYTLFDKDQFKLITSTLNLDDYGRMILNSGEKGPVLQEAGITNTYRQTGELSKSIQKRAVSGHCRIVL